MKLRPMTIRGWLAIVFIVALALAAVSYLKTPTRREPVFDPTGPVFSIEPPEWARHVDPYASDPPAPQ